MYYENNCVKRKNFIFRSFINLPPKLKFLRHHMAVLGEGAIALTAPPPGSATDYRLMKKAEPGFRNTALIN
jgi:hypothetical protein